MRFCFPEAQRPGELHHLDCQDEGVANACALCGRRKKLSKLEASNLRARWTTAYPVLPDTKSHGNGREKTRPDTSSAKLRQEAWDALMDLEENVKLRLELPKNLKDDFRLDPFGNVVALRAEPRFSVCGFQVDHIFPWARGGLTVRNNLMALHW